MVRRFDRTPLLKAVRTDAGFLRAPIRATRTGILEYAQPDGSIRYELRVPEEVFAEDSMKTLGAIPITNNHPNVLVDSGNSKAHMVGFTSENPRRVDEKFLDIDGTITDKQTIDTVDQGKQEVSCGYVCELDMSPGVFEGQHYDAIQRKIRYNHIAVVDAARAGPQVRIRLDGEGNQVEDAGGNNKMKMFEIDGKKFDVSEELHDALTEMFKKKDEGEKKTMDQKEHDELMKAEKKRFDALEAERDGLKADNEKLETELKTKTDAAPSDESIREAARERLTLLKTAEKVLPEDTKLDEMSDLEIKKAVIVSEDKNAKLDEKSEAYIEGRFDHVAASLATRQNEEDPAKKLGDTIVKGREDSSEDHTVKRDAAIKRDKERWKKPLSVSAAS